jgi:hypothetical protein
MVSIHSHPKGSNGNSATGVAGASGASAGTAAEGEAIWRERLVQAQWALRRTRAVMGEEQRALGHWCGAVLVRSWARHWARLLVCHCLRRWHSTLVEAPEGSGRAGGVGGGARAGGGNCFGVGGGDDGFSAVPSRRLIRDEEAGHPASRASSSSASLASLDDFQDVEPSTPPGLRLGSADAEPSTPPGNDGNAPEPPPRNQFHDAQPWTPPGTPNSDKSLGGRRNAS